MSIRHHPPDELLLEYAAGASGEAAALVLATHLALCPLCRRTVAEAEAVGGQLLEESAEEPLSANALERVLSHLDAAAARRPAAERSPSQVPEPLRSYIGGDFDDVPWRKIGGGHAYRPLLRRGTGFAYVMRSAPGAGVGLHTHRGEELTLCLSGGYSDETGSYARGDLQWSTPDILHRPVADAGGDCIVVAMSTARLKFSDPIAALIARWLGF
ncbi:MAG: ChrR family anti-sigma-E factor [Rhizomicrobium sp.]